MIKKWYAYILTNHKNTVFYTGITNNLKRRVWEHKKGLLKNSFTSKYRLYKLVWFEESTSPEQAILTEKRVKDSRREKKLNLIKIANPSFKDLYTLR